MAFGTEGALYMYTYMYVMYICICIYECTYILIQCMHMYIYCDCRLFKPRVLFELSLNTQMCKMCTVYSLKLTDSSQLKIHAWKEDHYFSFLNHPSFQVTSLLFLEVHRNQSFRCLRPTVLAPSCDALNLGFPTTGWNSDAWIETYMDEIWCHVVDMTHRLIIINSWYIDDILISMKFNEYYNHQFIW